MGNSCPKLMCAKFVNIIETLAYSAFYLGLLSQRAEKNSGSFFRIVKSRSNYLGISYWGN